MKIIVNADDLGKNNEMNTVISAYLDRGLVTSSTIMAGGNNFEEGVAIALKANTLIVKTQTFNVRGEDYIDNIYVQETALHNQNIDHNNCRNDIQINAVFSKYDIYSKYSKL